MQLVFAAEVCSRLGVLLSVLQVQKTVGSTRKINFKLVSDCESILHGFDASYRIVMITVKLSSTVREIILAKKEYILYLRIVKVDAHQDKAK